MGIDCTTTVDRHRITDLRLFGSAKREWIRTGGVVRDGAGGYRASQGGYGAEAYINVRDAAFCIQNSTSPNHISAWAMIAGSYSCEFAQAGHRKTEDITYWLDFAEYSDCYGNYNEKSYGTTALSNGTNHHYQVYYDTSVNPHVERMDISAGTYKLATNFDPVGDWTGPFTPFWMAELFDSGDEVPGMSTQETSFTSVQYQAHTSLTWSTPGVSEWTKSNQQGASDGKYSGFQYSAR